jgi:hypothetical protein
MDQNLATATRHAPWNKGRLIGQKPPLRLKEIWAIRIRLQLAKRARELALLNLAIDSKLRGCDLVRLRVCAVIQGQRVASRAMVLQRGTQRPPVHPAIQQDR